MSEQERINLLRRRIGRARHAHSALIAERRAGITPRRVPLGDGVMGLRTEHAVKLVCAELRAEVHEYINECRRMKH